VKPRRAIVLDETEHEQLERLEMIAQRVAGFLNKELIRVDDVSP